MISCLKGRKALKIMQDMEMKIQITTVVVEN